jgi:hypothetical protein
MSDSMDNFSRVMRDDAAAHRAVQDLAPSGSIDIVGLTGVILDEKVRIVAMSPLLHQDLGVETDGSKSLEDLVLEFALAADADPRAPGRLITKSVPTLCRADEVWIEYLGTDWAWIGYPDESHNS